MKEWMREQEEDCLEHASLVASMETDDTLRSSKVTRYDIFRAISVQVLIYISYFIR